MAVNSTELFIVPDKDDGRIKRPWIVDGEERCRTATQRVKQLFEERPWVIGNITETVRNGEEDQRGIDLFVPIHPDLVKLMGIKQEVRGVPVQVKSCDRAVVNFLIERELYYGGKFEFIDGNYIFTFNGQNPSELIVADMIGQMWALVKHMVDEDDFLDYLALEMGDHLGVRSWMEQRVIIEDSWWYRGLIIDE